MGTEGMQLNLEFTLTPDLEFTAHGEAEIR